MKYYERVPVHEHLPFCCCLTVPNLLSMIVVALVFAVVDELQRQSLTDSILAKVFVTRLIINIILPFSP